MQRYEQLDALRGIAATIVVANHAFNLIPGDNWDSWVVQWTPLGRLISGDVAVAVFFVLSGFVLSIPLTRANTSSYGAFVARRFLRIYPPFAVAVLMATCLAAWLAFPKPDWAANESDWASPVDLPLLIQHLAMIGIGYASISLDPPMWTLIQELRVALVFPLLVALIQRFGLGALIAVVVVAHVSTKLAAFQSFVGASGFGTLMLSVYFSYFFCIGIALYIYRDAIVARFRGIPFVWHAVVVLCLAFVPRHFIPSFLLSQAAYALFAVYAIALCLAFPAQLTFLEARLLQWLGRISYSLYLVHLPIMLAAKYLLYPQQPLWVVIPVAVAVSFAVAELFYWLVEAPAIRLSHILTRRPETTAVGAS